VSGTVLADTGPLSAAADTSDDHHERAQGDIRRLNSEGVGVTVAYPTLCECYSLVLYKVAALSNGH
jgi:predicted nucleic acid-binding protein